MEKNVEKDKKNIIVLLHAMDLNNGATRSMIDLIENLIKKNNIKIIALYPKYDEDTIKYLNSIGVKTYKVLFGRWDYLPNQKFGKKIICFIKSIIKQVIGIINIPKILKIMKNEDINIIYSNTSVIYEGAILSKITHIPHIWHIREFGEEDHGLKNMYGNNIFFKFLNNYTDAIIFISNSIKQKFENNIIDKSKIYVVYNDISKQFINPKKAVNKNEKLKMTIIGTIQEGKGQLDVVKAGKILKDKNINFELHIAGRKIGEYYNKICKYILENNLNKEVIFDGFIKDVNKYRKEFDIGIVASSNEAFGRVTIEGMLSGLAMIGANCAGTKELIEDNVNGLLYKLHDEHDLAEKIIMLDNNREKLKKISNNGFNYAVTNYTNGKASNAIYNIVNTL